MLTLKNALKTPCFSISTDEQPIENLLSKEWLLTNGSGGYASSTIAGCNTRGYHGLLIGSLNPPINRIMALSNCLEMIISNGKVFNISTFEFDNKFAPTGFEFLKYFQQDFGAHFEYELNNINLAKSLYLLREENTLVLVYDFKKVPESVEFVIRPFVALRDFHSLQKSYAPLDAEWLGNALLIRHNTPQSCRLFLNCPSSDFKKDKQWWFNFVYRIEKERGLNFTEDLWTPGFFKSHIDSPQKIVLWASLASARSDFLPENLNNININKVCENLQKYRNNLIQQTPKAKRQFRYSLSNSQAKNTDIVNNFYLAADQFIVKRKTKDKDRTTILAGYPWFADWGRDTFISLPGLLLSTGRFEQAKSVLTTFAAAADHGMIPARFDDNNNTTCFNSVDASLWFIIAAFQYLHATNDYHTFTHELINVIRSITDSYSEGTKFDIHADNDGLITAGNEQTQLTWMDAKYQGIAFTPRFGKAVEVNALWFNCLNYLTKFYADRDAKDAEQYENMAKQVGESFCRLFWNPKKEYLNDCILPDSSIDDSLRPNQIYAVSLEFSPLSLEQQKSIVNTVQNNLLTPYGLRTLDKSSPNYIGRYTGPQSDRDKAYHQGTVWPFLIGPFIESYLKVNNFSSESKQQAEEFIRPLLKHMNETGCIGSISEIFDGDEPQQPKGCFAQAWSVAELIRAYLLINC